MYKAYKLTNCRKSANKLNQTEKKDERFKKIFKKSERKIVLSFQIIFSSAKHKNCLKLTRDKKKNIIFFQILIFIKKACNLKLFKDFSF